MPLTNPLAVLNLWMTYLIQVAFAYLVVWGLSLLVRNARVRLKMWGCFLSVGTFYWIYLSIPHGSPAGPNVGNAAGVTLSQQLAPGWSWAIPQTVADHLSRFSMWVLIVYAAIVVTLLLQSIARSWALRRFLGTGCDAPADVNAVFDEMCRELRVSRCRLVLMPGLRSPATANWWRPYVLLPAELACELDENQLGDVLRHELIHICRHDYLWDRLAAVACRVVFFHPVMWLAHGRLRWERELACDEAVVRYNSEHRVEYAECLTTLARWWFLADKSSPGAIGFASSASLLGTRVRALLLEPVSYSVYQRGARAALVAAVLAVSAMSLPGMRLNFYWSQPQHLFSAPQAQIFGGARKIMRASPRLVGNDSQVEQSTPTISADQNPVIAPGDATNLAVIEKPTMPVFAGLEQHSAPEDISGAAGGAGTVGNTSGATSAGGGIGAPQPTVKKPSWTDTAVDAITTGVAIIRSRTSAPAGTPGAPGGGTSGGGSGGGGEGPDHFTAPN